MNIVPVSPAKSLPPAYRAQSLGRAPMDAFKKQFRLLITRIAEAGNESEEHLKNIVAEFLKEVWYRDEHYINTRDRQDLVIHTGKTVKESVGVILEVKKPGNRSEMMSKEKPNAKALHELLRYYLNERQSGDNREIKRLVITNIDEWYIFDAADFERHIYSNNKLLNSFAEWKEGRLGVNTTDWFYKEIAAPFFEKELPELSCTWFKITDFAQYAGVRIDGSVADATKLQPDNPDDDEQLLDLYKILSPEFLLKKPFANDSNALNKRFYEELLYIIGLEEEKDGGKKLIKRAKKRRSDGSFLENTLGELEVSGTWRDATDLDQFGDNKEDQQYSIALELCITWLNRILFLKLLEGQMVRWKPDFKTFLHPERVRDFDELNELFFHVLAVPEKERRNTVTEKFGGIPYLNSSLFEQTELERRTLRVSALKDRLTMPLAPNTILKDGNTKRREGDISTLHYLFHFLEAYDFSSDARARVQEDHKDIINASVLGLIFEKINGYKDGSFFTPGFITMYMCRETIRRSVLQKFNAAYGWSCGNVETDLYNNILRQNIPLKDANEQINSIRICDPAVGSGHFLVSALNELIAVKSDLGILCDQSGKLVRIRAAVGNDELILTDADTDEQMEYRPGNALSQRAQETLFHEKQTLIENCLFGVDINPKSVMICRLRLWVELLKHAYFTAASQYQQLETLPNIDINIKSGNSLISRFALDEDLSDVFKRQQFSRKGYMIAVESYKKARDKEGKEELRRFIQKIKDEFRQTVFNRNPFVKKMSELRGKRDMLAYENLFGEKKLDDKEGEKQKQKLTEDLADLEVQLETYKTGPLFRHSFEWRFEFPEVLDESGGFVGFDVVVGNPPYIRQEELASQKPYFQQHYKTFAGTADLYVYFVERAMQVLRPGGQFSYILPNKWMRAGYGDKLRQFTQQFHLTAISDFGDLPVFEEATTYPCIFEMQNAAPQPQFNAVNISTLTYENGLSDYVRQHQFAVNIAGLQDSGWTLTNQTVQNLLGKLRAAGKPLGEYVNGKIYRGVLTGLNEAFVIDAATRDRLIAEDARSGEVIKPFLAGRDIKRYQTVTNTKFLIFTKRGINLNNYPAIQSYLLEFKDRLEPKPKHFVGDNWPGRKEGSYLWYELQDSIDYFKEFENPKILFAEIATRGQFTIDVTNLYCDTTGYILGSDSKYLIGILNSKLVTFLFSKISSEIRGGFLRWKRQYVETIPIPDISVPDQEPIIKLIDQVFTVKQSNPQADTAALEAEIDRLVYGLYGLGEEEIKIIEGL